MGRHSTRIDAGSEAAAERPDAKRKREDDHGIIVVDVSSATPPSKKALRKARRQSVSLPDVKARKPPSGSEDALPTKGDITSNKSEHGVWIGNLGWLLSKDDVRKYFEDNAGIPASEIIRVHLPAAAKSSPALQQKVKPKNKGFAYVNFSSAESQTKAIASSETLFAGRKVLIKDASNFEGRPDATKGPAEKSAKASPQRSCRVFIGNLDFDASTEDLTRLFEACGPIADVHLATFQDSGKCKGYAWLTFENFDAADLAVTGWKKVVPDKNFSDIESEEPDLDPDGARNRPKSRAIRAEKRYFNRLRGRQLRVELAEDASTRYRKRFGKDVRHKEQTSNIDETQFSSELVAPNGADQARRMAHDVADAAKSFGSDQFQGRKTILT